MAFSRDPALAIWQAMKPLAEVGARTDAPDRKDRHGSGDNPVWFGASLISATTKYGIDTRHSRLAHRANYAFNRLVTNRQ